MAWQCKGASNGGYQTLSNVIKKQFSQLHPRIWNLIHFWEQCLAKNNILNDFSPFSSYLFIWKILNNVILLYQTSFLVCLHIDQFIRPRLAVITLPWWRRKIKWFQQAKGKEQRSLFPWLGSFHPFTSCRNWPYTFNIFYPYKIFAKTHSNGEGPNWLRYTFCLQKYNRCWCGSSSAGQLNDLPINFIGVFLRAWMFQRRA